MEITCPECGETIDVSGLGRKSLSIPFAIVCKAVKESLRDDGRPHWSEAARNIKKATKIKVTPGFVQIRMTRAAKSAGVGVMDLIVG